MHTRSYILTVTVTASEAYAEELVNEGIEALAESVVAMPGDKVTLAQADGTFIAEWEN
jgi:hypothetical protein